MRTDITSVMKVSLRHFIIAFDNFLHIFSILPAGTIELNEYSLNTVSVAELQILKSLTNCMMSHKIVKGPEFN